MEKAWKRIEKSSAINGKNEIEDTGMIWRPLRDAKNGIMKVIGERRI